MKYMKRYTLLAALAAVTLFASCTREEEMTIPGSEGEPVTVLLSASTVGAPEVTRGTTTGTGDGRDGEFSSLRVMVFHAGSMLAYSKSVDLTVEGNPFTIEMTTGTYDFVFIANEDSDPALSLRLDAYKGKNIGSIFGESFSSTAFGNTATIPMTSIVRNVVVTADDMGVGSISVGGTPQSNPWAVEVERAAVRVDLALRTKERYTVDNFSALQIDNVPGKVYLFGKNGSGNDLYNVAGGDPFEGTPRTIDGGDGDTYDSTGDAYTEGDETFTTTPDKDGYYWWYKRVILPSSLFANAADKNKAIVLTAVVGDRTLSAELGSDELGYTAPRNQRYRFVGTVEAGGPIEYTVSVTPWGANTDVELPFKLPDVPGSGTALSDNTYVGAFWKASEKGERVIRIPVTKAGTWAVQVYEYGAGFNRGDILFSAEDTGSDAVLYGAGSDPGAEAYAVAGKAYAKGGTYQDGTQYYVKFRIGLKNTYPATKTAPARYAVALIAYTPTGGETIYQKLFLRQGEGADYLMAPGDAGMTTAGITGRPNTIPFSPYNLTTPNRYEDYFATTGLDEILTLNGGAHTGYPTQVGSYWQFRTLDERYAISPIIRRFSSLPRNGGPSPEPCPEGYRTPVAGEGTAVDNEFFQSLIAKESSTAANSVTGYYADGYFDRGEIVSPPGKYPQPKTAVNTSSVDVAYAGHLFYNPVSESSHHNASLFFPFGGIRSAEAFQVQYVGARGGYWSGSLANSSAYGFMLYFFGKAAHPTETGYVLYPMSLRCVADERWTPASGTLTATGPDYMRTDGSTHTVSVTSNTEWVATVQRTSDVMTSGPVGMRGRPLLNPATGFNTSPANAGYGPSTSRIVGSGNATLTLTTADYTLPYGVVSGTLEIVFLSRATDELLATVKIPAGLSEITDDGNAKEITTYVGAFWKADQRGERLISMTVPTSTNYRGNWSVQVLDYGGFSEGDILFGTWDGVLPQDDYPSDTPALSGNATYLTGAIASGKFYFRIGLKQTIGTKDHRYARVLVSFGKDHAYNRVLFLRQGHEPDYVMHPNDVDAERRGQVREFSPYNLTASLTPGEGLTTDLDYAVVPTEGGTFTAYPTQAGAMFLWCAQPGFKRRAWHPVKTYASDVWQGTNAYETTPGLPAEDETCPVGYRRPTTEPGNMTPTTTSEIGLSLTADPGVDNGTNSVRGYYADGFFDRRFTGARSVESDNYKVAYDGRLFYNNSPNNPNASLFFPAAGYRNAGTGDLHNFTSYWTGTSLKGSSDSGTFFYIEYSASNPVRFDIGSIRNTGGVIRCVKDE